MQLEFVQKTFMPSKAPPTTYEGFQQVCPIQYFKATKSYRKSKNSRKSQKIAENVLFTNLPPKFTKRSETSCRDDIICWAFKTQAISETKQSRNLKASLLIKLPDNIENFQLKLRWNFAKLSREIFLTYRASRNIDFGSFSWEKESHTSHMVLPLFKHKIFGVFKMFSLKHAFE